jgi:hypothetical protein
MSAVCCWALSHVAPVLAQGSSIINVGSMAGISGGLFGHIYSVHQARS